MEARENAGRDVLRAMVRAALFGALAVGTACAGGGDGYGTEPPEPGGGSAVGASNTVTIRESSFSPATITVDVGATVSWVWPPCSGDGYYACPTHNVTFDDGSNISSGSRDTGLFTRSFSVAGTYKYHCKVHGANMSGTVVVK